MKAIFILIIGLAFTNLGDAQTLTVLDRETEKPITFASILFYNDTALLGGTYTDQSGNANLVSSTAYKKIKISCIGYRDTVINAANLQDTIFLQEEISMLNEVVVLSDNSEAPIVHLGFKKAKRHTSTIGSPKMGSQVVTRIDNPFQVDKKIQAIEFWVDYKKFAKSGYLKVVFFEIDGLIPGNQIDFELVFRNDELKKEMRVSLEDKNFSIPKEGFFMGIEWMSCIQNKNSEEELECVNRITGNFNKNESIKHQVFVRDKFDQIFWMDLNEFAPYGSYLPAFGIYVYE